MPTFAWNKTVTGGWDVAANWISVPIGAADGPPGKGDAATFDNQGSGTVNVTTTVDVDTISIATPSTSNLTFSISGSLTTGQITYSTPLAIDMTVNAGGLLIVNDALSSAVAPETITISGGHLELGDFTVGENSVLGPNVTFDFANTGPTALNTGVIQFDRDFQLGTTVASQTITDVARGDEFVITGANFRGDTVALIGSVLTVRDDKGNPAFTMSNVSLEPGAANAFAIVGDDTIEAACYARGTMILTDRGEVPIEELSIGDRVVTLLGEARPIRWIGRRAYDARFVAGNRTLLPILIRQDALGDGEPRRDLYVSPKHALFLDDVLVPAEQLVNGVSIVRCDTVATVEYFHIELDTHDIILAEGAPSETFVDCDNRFMFQNASEFARLYPDCNIRTWAFCAPRIEDGDVLQHLRWRLDERLEAFGSTTTFDPNLHLVVDGIPVLANRVDDTVHVFRLQSPARQVRIVSRSSVPAELDVAFTDTRRLGVNVSRVVLSSDDVNIVVGCQDTSLVDGFHASEGTHRWTDGDARVPAKFLACFDKDMTIEVHVLNYEQLYRTGQWEAERFAEKAA